MAKRKLATVTPEMPAHLPSWITWARSHIERACEHGEYTTVISLGGLENLLEILLNVETLSKTLQAAREATIDHGLHALNLEDVIKEEINYLSMARIPNVGRIQKLQDALKWPKPK